MSNVNRHTFGVCEAYEDAWGKWHVLRHGKEIVLWHPSQVSAVLLAALCGRLSDEEWEKVKRDANTSLSHPFKVAA